MKKSREREIAKQGDIFVAPKHHLPQSVYLPEPEPQHVTHHPHPHPIAPQPVVEHTPVVTHNMSRSDIVKFMLMRTLGNFLILLSLYGIVATFGPALYYEVQFQVIKARGIHFAAAHVTPNGFSSVDNAPTTTGSNFGDIIAGAQSQVLVPPDTKFSIVIPRIGATAKVWPNIDPLNEAEFLPKLQTGVAHAKGSVFPGMQGNVYLFAHSTDNFWDVGRYNAVFYLLKDMKPGDDISVYFENTRYNYKVDHTVIKDPNDVDFLVHSQVPGKEQLILQTCWPPGTTWKRLFVIATPVKN